mmetsp:Transcript_132550/g.424175  ORF Transcript_132550/g.424175 Transcript_132550/m.424175 type:complete len:539 (-) Transcript_132550:68-1684(-)
MMFKKKKDEDAKPVAEEIAELQRKFRVLENDKRACAEDSQGKIRKQRAAIEKLSRENNKMKSELNETRSSSGPGPEARIAMESIGKLNDQRDTLLQRLEGETEASGSLQGKLDSTSKNIFSIRGDMAKNGGINASLDNAKAVAKQIRVIENRLDKALQNFNQAIAANRTLREQIDTLRRERVVFDDIYRKLENELQQKKKEMANIIEQANAAYEARDQAQAQMAALKQQADREHVEFEREWKDLGKLIQNDKKMKDFMKGKVQASKEANSTHKDKTEKRDTRHAWDNTERSLAAISGSQEQVANYEEAFSRIQAATGITDLETLVLKFIADEHSNFGLFNYNNELSADIEKLEQQTADYREEFVTLSGTGKRKEDVEKMKILEMLEEKWNDIDGKAKTYETKYIESQQTLQHTRTGIESIFRRIGCSPDDLPNGAGKTISEGNMLQFVGAIETRTQELLKAYDAINDGGEDLEVTRPRARGGTANLQVNKLPSTVEDYSDDEDDDDEDDQRPFTVEELKAKTRAKTRKAASKSKAKTR